MAGGKGGGQFGGAGGTGYGGASGKNGGGFRNGYDGTYTYGGGGGGGSAGGGAGGNGSDDTGQVTGAGGYGGNVDHPDAYAGTGGTDTAAGGGGGGGGNGTVLNATGGNGGAGGYGTSFGGGGGAGGYGYVARLDGFTNAGSIAGGNGGNGGGSSNDGGVGGNGGDGGVGAFVATTGSTFTNAALGSITGGIGGASGDAGTSGVAGSGGAGLGGSSGGVTIQNSGAIQGGDGGTGTGTGTAGTGGAGVAVTGSTVTNTDSGTITGGAGGYSDSGTVGTGGAGVAVTSSTVTNTGTAAITGGAGASSFFAGGSGGAGIDGGDGSVVSVQSGTVTGGASGGGLAIGGTGGAGVALAGTSSVTVDDGTVRGGVGSNGFFSKGPGGAGIAADVTSNVTVNGGTVEGGAGADGSGGYGQAGGYGGAGIAARSATVTGGTVTGGSGGLGGDYGGTGGSNGGRGGSGGAGIDGYAHGGGGGLDPFPTARFVSNAAAAPNVFNVTDGTVTGGAGANGGYSRNGYGGAGGDGGAGIAGGGSDVTNASTVTGGVGGQGGGSYHTTGGRGGNGGAGITNDGANITTSGAVTGGAGGQGGVSTYGSAGDGGAGGTGIDAGNNTSSVTIQNGGSATGGAGGGDGGNGSGGGNGGDGVSGAYMNLTSNGTIAGGQGGDGYVGGHGGSGVYAYASNIRIDSGSVTGGNGGNSSAVNASSGTGGIGIADGGYSTVSVGADATVTGGNGGNGGNGGYGGAGVASSGFGMTLTSSGTIAGGTGGAGYSASRGGTGIDAGDSAFVTIDAGSVSGGTGGAGQYGGPGGQGGEGVVGSNLTLVNYGTISGGLEGETQAPMPEQPGPDTSADAVAAPAIPTRANALDFTGGSNTLALGANAVLNGAINIGGEKSRDLPSLTFDQGLADGLPADVTIANDITGSGSVIKFGSGTLTFSSANNTYGGGTTINAGVLDLAAAGAAGAGAISFRAASSQGTQLALETSAQNIGGTFGNTLSFFDAGDSLELKGFAFNSMSATITPTNRTFTVQDFDGRTQTFDLSRSNTQTYYAHDDGNGGTLIDTNAPCYATGTLIRTSRGDVAVEALAVGDLAVTASGAHHPIRWLGHRVTDCRRHPRPQDVMPVRIAAHAFGENRPARDLVVSPGHSLCVDIVGEVLIPAMALINGTTIVQEDVESVTYWHVELEVGHDILLAENLPAESYLDMGNRGFFAEAAVVDLEAAPDAPVGTHADFCRPFHADGAMVEVVRAQLAVRAKGLGWRLEEQGLGDLHLMVDGVRVEPRVRGLSARFTVPAGAAALWLVSSTAVPTEIAASCDRRPLGLCIAGLTLDDGFGAPRVVAIDDPCLHEGFYSVERDGAFAWRWTAGRACFPSTLFDGMDDGAFLRIDLSSPALPRWVAPDKPVDARSPLCVATGW